MGPSCYHYTMEQPSSEDRPLREDYSPTPKPEELLQAQVAAFAAERLAHGPDEKHVFDNMSSIANSQPTSLVRMTTENEYPTQDGEPSKISPGTDRTIATIGQYADYLREVGGSASEEISRRAQLLTRYKTDFEPIVQPLLEDLRDPTSRRLNDRYIGSGTISQAFLIPHQDQEYVVRLPSGPNLNPQAIDKYMRVAIQCIGIPHTEQMVAASYETGVTVSERMPGVELGNLGTNDLGQITPDQLSELIGTIEALNNAGLHLDPKTSNIFYDKDQGFGVIDSNLRDTTLSADQNLVSSLRNAAHVISQAGIPSSLPTTKEDFASSRDMLAVSLPLLIEFQASCRETVSGEVGELAAGEINQQIEATQELIENYSNEEWVDNRIQSSKHRTHQAEQDRASAVGSGLNTTTIKLDIPE
ncbi:MAG: hypothetical protein JWN01_380 [Patescibacteria group bacterium]|nr:hypothetical protein [Patescibacteria group bacterium]